MVQVQDRLSQVTHGATSAQAPLAVDDLAVHFGAVTAVDGLRLRVARGEIVGLVGPNGCGKTTTLRVIMGLVEPNRGNVFVAGQVAGSLEARALVSWLPDEPAGLDELTVGEFLDLVQSLYDAGERFVLFAATLLDAFGLADRRRTMLGALSHGSRRIVAFVAAVALRPQLLVVDEATAALDPGAVLVLREILRAQARRAGGVLLATQDLNFAAVTCDRVSLLDHGRVVVAGRVDRLLARYAARSLEDVFVAALGREGRILELRRALDAF